MEPDEILKLAAEPHLVASAAKANELLAHLNALITDLRMEVRDLELAADLHRNKLLQQENKPIALKESEFKISEEYKIWQKRKGYLSDIRSIRKALQRHADILYEQEKYSVKQYGGYRRAIE